jgi:hypothetical protein
VFPLYFLGVGGAAHQIFVPEDYKNVHSFQGKCTLGGMAQEVRDANHAKNTVLLWGVGGVGLGRL